MNNKIFDPQVKVIANVDRVLELLDTGNTPPVLVEFDTSNACNHSCYFCISGYIHLPESKGLPTFNRSMLSEKLMLSTCQDFINMGVRAVNWTGGGEPTANPALSKCVKLLGQNDVKMGMFTNGTLIHRFPELLDTLVENMTWIRFSVDAGTEKTYNDIRRTTAGKDDWNMMLSNLNKIIDAKDNYEESVSKDPFDFQRKLGPDIGVGMVITPDNYWEIINFAETFLEYDISYCQFKPEIVNREREGGIQRDIDFWYEHVEPRIKVAKDILGDKFQMNGYKLSDLQHDPSILGRTYKKCLGSQIQPCVGADGEVYVCCNHRGYKEYSYGNLNEKSFKDIWNDIEKRQAIMYQIDDVDKFNNCTQLCKPHESSKQVWKLYEEYENVKSSEVDLKEWKNNLLDIERSNARTNVDHWEFI